MRESDNWWWKKVKHVEAGQNRNAGIETLGTTGERVILLDIADPEEVSAAFNCKHNLRGEDIEYFIFWDLQSDPDLVTSSGERVLVTKSGWPLNRGQIPLISYIGGNLSCH
eukprot:sb/3477142/